MVESLPHLLGSRRRATWCEYLSRVRDTTGSNHAEAQVRSLARFPEENPNPVLRAAAGGLLLYANQAARAMLQAVGWRPGAPLVEPLLSGVGLVLSGAGSQEVEVQGLDGRVWSVALSASVRNQVNLYGRDITRRKQAEEALRQSRDALEDRVRQRTAELTRTNAELDRRARQLARLASELTLAEQRERHRLAQVLHDHLQQLLVSGRFRLQEVVARMPLRNRSVLAEVRDLLDEAIAASRSLTVELFPPILHEAGLVAGLQWLGRWFREKHGLEVDLDLDPRAEEPSEELKVLFFQAARELLLNVVKHAQVRCAGLALRALPGEHLQLAVSNGGRGFDPASLQPPGDRMLGGFGLFSLRERLGLLGGWLEVDSQPGRGSRFVVTVERAPDGSPLAPGTPAHLPSGHGISADAAPRPGGTTGRIRILLADDHVVVRQGLSLLLDSEADMEVVGQASDGEQAVLLARQLRPDVVLMDNSMPRMGGVDATRAIRGELPGVRVVGLSMFDEADRAAAMMAAGAVAYVSKSSDPRHLLEAMRSAFPAHDGQT
ncbi:MAG: response regulator [Candidatus Latescibacterota bacterium]